MNTYLVSIALVIALLELCSSSSTRKASTVTKLPENIDQYFRSSLGIEGFKQWYVHCQPYNVTVRDCDFCLGKTSLEHKKTTWIRHRFQIKARSKTSKIALDYLKVLHLGGEIFLVAWIEYDELSNRRLKRKDDKEMVVKMYVKFMTINLHKNSTNEGSSMNFPVTLSSADDISGFLQNCVESMEILIGTEAFTIIYLASKNLDLVHETFSLDGRTSSEHRVAINENSTFAEDTVRMTSYPMNSDVLRSQERILNKATGLCKRTHCDPADFVGRKHLCGCSTTNGYVSSCVRSIKILPRQWNCTQENPANEIKSILMTGWVIPKWFMVHNLQGGDLLTITGAGDEYPVRYKKYCGGGASNRTEEFSKGNLEVIKTFHIRRFGMDGQEYAGFKFAELDSDCSALIGNFFENGKDTCFSMLWMNDEFLGSEIGCYDDEILREKAQLSRRVNVKITDGILT